MNLLLVIPEFFMLGMLVVIMLTGLFNKSKRWSYYLTQATLLGTAYLVWQVYAGSGTQYAFGQMLVFDPIALLLSLMVLLLSFFVLLYARDYLKQHAIPENEFYMLSLVSVLGMLVLITSNNLLTLYLGVEIFSLPLYAMVALQRQNVTCVEAAMKYFVLGAVASGIMLYGISMIFGVTHSLDLTHIAYDGLSGNLSYYLLYTFGMVFLIAGVIFKLGAVPFHMWVPDVYQGAPVPVTMFIGGAPKIAAFALAVRVLVVGLPALAQQWDQILLIVSLLSMAIGNIAAIVQDNLKRMLAYSSIAHMGYMLLGFLTATPRGEAAAMFYIISYALMTVAAFGVITVMSHKGYEAEKIEDFAGLNTRAPWLAFMMLLVMFSMAGIPPLVGFMAKVGVLEALIRVHLVWVAVVALLFAIIGAYYYLRVVKVMYFEVPRKSEVIHYGVDSHVALSINCLAVLILGIFPGWLFHLCQQIFMTV